MKHYLFFYFKVLKMGNTTFLTVITLCAVFTVLLVTIDANAPMCSSRRNIKLCRRLVCKKQQMTTKCGCKDVSECDDFDNRCYSTKSLFLESYVKHKKGKTHCVCPCYSKKCHGNPCPLPMMPLYKHLPDYKP